MNVLYLIYFILKSDYSYLKEEMKKVQKKNHISTLIDMFYSTLKYGNSLEDYFIYEFYKKNNEEKETYITTAYAYNFFKKMNDNKYLEVFRNKEDFDKKFINYIKRDTILVDKVSEEEFIKWSNSKKELIIKPIDGVQGKGIYITKIESEKEIRKLFHDLKSKNYIVEEVIQQHHILQELNPSCINSIRIITININNTPKIIAAILRIGVGGIIDNFSEGGIAAPIDLETGIVFKEAITKKSESSYEYHPITKQKIVGIEIPYWDKTKEIILAASQEVPEIKTVGWDVAITENGPDIIEGNDNWNKDVFQLPFDKGKKDELKQILKENKV